MIQELRIERVADLKNGDRLVSIGSVTIDPPLVVARVFPDRDFAEFVPGGTYDRVLQDANPGVMYVERTEA